MSDDLDLDLSTAAAAYDIPAGNVDLVVRRGRRRAARRRTAMALTTSVAVVVSAVAGFGLLDGDDSGIPVAAGAGMQKGDSGISWKQVGSSSSLAFPRAIDGSGPVYALSTAPGDVDPDPRTHSRVLWRSEDGVDWQSVSTLGDDLFLSDLSQAGDRIYAVGTGPATAAVPGQRATSEFIVGWSDDGGKSWNKATLPLDVRAIAAKTSASGLNFTEVAAGAKGTVAVAVPYATLDVTKVLPAGATAPHGWATTPTGVDILGPRPSEPCPSGTSEDPPGRRGTEVGRISPPGNAAEVHPIYCYRGEVAGTGRGQRGAEEAVDTVEISPQDAHGVSRHYTWDELGVDGDLLNAVRRQPVAFAAGPGSTEFERVELPDIESVQPPITAQADDEGFNIVVARGAGRPVGRGYEAPPLAILRSVDGRKWSAVDIASSGLGWVAAAGRIGDRTALVGVGRGEVGEPVLLRSDGAGGWTSSGFGDVVSRPPGTHLAVVAAGVGPMGLVAVVAPVPAKPPVPSEPSVAAPPEPERQPEFQLMSSRDGTTWESQPLDALAGARVNGISSIVVTDDRAVITAILAPEDEKKAQKPKRVTLVGTLD